MLEVEPDVEYYLDFKEMSNVGLKIEAKEMLYSEYALIAFVERTLGKWQKS